jgi:MFS family permease
MKFSFKSLPFLYIFSFSTNLFVGMLGLALPLFALSLGAGNVTLGAFGTTASFVYIICVPFSGWLADRVPKNLQAGAGVILFGGTLCLIPFVTKLAWLYPLVVSYIIGLALLWPSLESALGRFVSGRALARSAGWYNVSWSSGATIGYLVSGFVYEKSAAWVFWSAGGLAVLFGVMFSTFFRAPEHKEDGNGGAETGPIYLLYISWFLNGTLYFVLNIIRFIFPKLAGDLGLSSANLGWLLLFLSLSQCLLLLVMNLTAVWHFKFWPMAAAMLIAAAGLVIVALSHGMPGFALGFFLVGGAAGVTYSGSLYYAVSLEKSVAGSRSGWHEFYLGFGGFSGPLIGGLLAQYIGPKTPYSVSAGLVLLMLMAMAAYYRAKSRG